MKKGGKSDRNIPDWTGKEQFEKNTIRDGGKGRCQKRFSGFCPLRGGVPPNSVKEKIR